jgi:regulation of enolase protein 1 (concanavalin A-like superfamily)
MSSLPNPFTRLKWFNPPPAAEWRGSALLVRPAPATDFWQRTHYGFQADSGHFLFEDISADFVCAVDVQLRPVHQYNQAGLMVRLSPECWLKTSVEFERDGPNYLGAVVTNLGYSDWSTQPLDPSIRCVRFRLQRRGAGFLIHAAPAPHHQWIQLRICHLLQLQPRQTVSAGIYACSPKGAGFEAEFFNFSLQAR